MPKINNINHNSDNFFLRLSNFNVSTTNDIYKNKNGVSSPSECLVDEYPRTFLH